MASDFTIIDGSILEGGGQIIRNGVSYSALLGKPVHLVKIRAGRKKPGLRNQHLTGIQLIKDMYRAKTSGDRMTSMDVKFNPGNVQDKQSYVVDAKTAGSVCLLFQISFPCLLFSPTPTTVTYIGGTNASFAPQIDYTTLVFQPVLKQCLGVKMSTEIKKRGYFPIGGGEVSITIQPVKKLKAFKMTDMGEVKEITIRSMVAKTIPRHVAERMAESASALIKKELPNVPINVEIEEQRQSQSPGCGIVIAARTSTGCVLGGSALGERRKRAEKVAEQAARELLCSINRKVCADEHLQDQLIQLMALADGTSEVLTGPISMHTKTAIHFSELMTGCKFDIKHLGNEQNLLTCKGIGFENKAF